MERWLRKNTAFFIFFILISIVYLSSLLVHHDIWWDSAVFLGMGKYIYSFGSVGLWEASRPLLWPIVLGFYWKLGLNPILFGEITAILFSLGTVLLVYIIASRLFDRKIAFIASFFLSLSQTFFVFSNIMQTEIPSTFFVLLGLYFFIRRLYNYSGLFLGIAFMTRFFQLFIAFPLFLLLLYLTARNKENVRAFLNFCVFFLIPVVPYLIFNYFLYGSLFYPFAVQAFMTKYTGWVFNQPLYFYFVSIVKENFLAVFSILGLVFALRRYNFGRYALAFAFLGSFMLYNAAMHKEMRLLIPVLPLLYILASYGMVYFAGLLKKRRNLVLYSLLAVFFALSLPDLRFDSYEDGFGLFYEYIKEADAGSLWISNPAFIAFSDKKADELVYYPLYGSERIDQLERNIGNAGAVLINTCDILPCPSHDEGCSKKHSDFINLLTETFSLARSAEKGSCKYYIFEKIYN